MSLVPIEDLRNAANVTTEFAAARLPQILAGAEQWFTSRLRRQLTPLPALVPVDPPTDPVTYTDTAEPHVHRQVVRGSRFIRVPDARVITSVTIDDVEVGVDDYELIAHPFPERGPATHVEILDTVPRGRVAEVTGRFGFLELPPSFHEAIVTLAARRVYEESAGLVDATDSGEWGSRQYVKQIPSFVAMIVANATVPDDRLGL